MLNTLHEIPGPGKAKPRPRWASRCAWRRCRRAAPPVLLRGIAVSQRRALGLQARSMLGCGGWPRSKTAGQAQRDRLLTGFHLFVRDTGRSTLAGTKLQFVTHGPPHDEQTVPGRRTRTKWAKAAQTPTPNPRHLSDLDLSPHHP